MNELIMEQTKGLQKKLRAVTGETFKMFTRGRNKCWRLWPSSRQSLEARQIKYMLRMLTLPYALTNPLR